jgi:hypothetical protein
MEWKHYWRRVVAHYKVMIEGWPNNIPFKNLSEAASALHELKSLLKQWQDGRIHWKQLTDQEAKHLLEEQRVQGKVPDATRRTQSNHGKKCKQPPTACTASSEPDATDPEEAVSNRTRKHQKITSMAAVDSGDDLYNDNEHNDED